MEIYEFRNKGNLTQIITKNIDAVIDEEGKDVDDFNKLYSTLVSQTLTKINT